MKRINIIYWCFTGLLAALMLMSAVTNMMVTKDSVEMITNHLGFPEYMVFFVGLAKLLGVIAILVPGFPLLKEWAYAGLTFDLTGAIYGSIAVGDPFTSWAPILIGYVLIAGSYIFYHKKIKLKS